MDEPASPRSAKALARRLAALNRQRKALNRARRQRGGPRRQSLTKAQRREVLLKADARCHLCGGLIEGAWQADHVLAHGSGGRHSVDNYLPAHRLCNNYRWHYSAEEFQWILKLGVWSRTQIERGTNVGAQMADAFFAYELRREGRRKVR